MRIDLPWSDGILIDAAEVTLFVFLA